MPVMRRYAILQKRRGETPLEALKAYQAAHPEYAGIPASYAGRLDPMAEGKLLVLLGEECRKQARYTGLDKEYEIEVLVGIGSDTGDALGITDLSASKTAPVKGELARALNKEKRTHLQKYPAYSSKTVNGKPLFLYALEGRLGEIEIPEHEETIYSIRLLGQEAFSADELRAYIEKFLALVPHSDEPSKILGADFRIEAVRKGWEEVFRKAGTRTFAILKLRVSCGSGTYMRSLAGRIGESLGTKALALSIRRTRIGRRLGGLWLGL